MTEGNGGRASYARCRICVRTNYCDKDGPDDCDEQFVKDTQYDSEEGKAIKRRLEEFIDLSQFL